MHTFDTQIAKTMPTPKGIKKDMVQARGKDYLKKVAQNGEIGKELIQQS